MSASLLVKNMVVSAVLATSLYVGAQAAEPAATGSRVEPEEQATTQASIGERETLALALAELRAIERLLADAERRATPNARLVFDYEALRAELSLVRGGIAQYLGGERTQPRRFEPLSADYSGLRQ